MNNIVDLIIKVIVAAPIAFWLYRDARSRDYNWFFWVIVPFLVIFTPWVIAIPYFIILVIAYFMLRPKGALFKCPHCKKPVHEILFVCPFCKKNAKKECLSCHEPVPWEAEQCPHCRSRAITKE